MLAFFLKPFADYLEAHLPPALYDTLKSVLTALSALYLYLSQYLPEGSVLQLQSVLPALISLITLFLAIRSLYRSTIFAIRTAWFFLKWGTVVGGIAWMFGGGQGLGGALQHLVGMGGRQFNNNNPNAGYDMGTWLDAWLTSPTSPPRRNTRARSARQAKAKSKRPLRAGEQPPTVFDSFEAHRAYAARLREREREEAAAGGTGGGEGPLGQIYEQVQDAWVDNGKWWWETLGRVAGFMESDDEDEGQETGKRRSSRKKTKQTANSRAR